MEFLGALLAFTQPMHPLLRQNQTRSLLDDTVTLKKLQLNHRRNQKQDCTEKLDASAEAFRWDDCKDEYWNPEKFSLLYNTPLWNQSSPSQRVLLNQLYWVAYYAQIISAEIATIYYNQTCAAGLFGLEDFRLVCDTLDLETSQERAHISAFKKVSEEVEARVFGERLFTYPMRTPFVETMIYNQANRAERFFKSLGLQAFGLISSNSPFLACQYFTVRGIRTLKGKLVQHGLSEYFSAHPQQEKAPQPSRISYYHFMDESYHFNSSTIIGHDVIRSLPDPNALERRIANVGLLGCQKDHQNFSIVVNGIFWYDPALHGTIYRLLRSKPFGMDDGEARQMLTACFAQETDALHDAAATHRTAVESYKAYLADFAYVDAANKEMRIMQSASIPKYLEQNQKALRRFDPQDRGPLPVAPNTEPLLSLPKAS